MATFLLDSDVVIWHLRGRQTVHLPDALIGATAAINECLLYTCNTSHYSSYDIQIIKGQLIALPGTSR